MRALTLWQPWASFMFAGLPYPAKRIETRSWGTRYRGRLAIHAAKREGRWVKGAFLADKDRALLMACFLLVEDYGDDASLERVFDRLPRGAVLGTVSLDEVVPTEEVGAPALTERALGDYGPGRWAWKTSGARRLESPLLWKGHQGLWSIETDALREVS